MGSVANRNTLHKILVLLLFVPMALGAKQNEVSPKEKSILKDIEVVTSILEDNTASANNLAGEIANLEYQVIAARKIISLIDEEVDLSKQELLRLREQLDILDAEKKEAIIQFQSILLEEYKNRDYKRKLYYLASSKNISEFANRLNHLNTLKDFRMKHLKAIDNKQKEVMDKLAVYNGSKSEKNRISENKTVYISKLNELLRVKHQRYKQIESENQSLQLRLKERNKYLEELNKEVDAVINTSEAEVGSNLMELKWPVTTGLVVSQFGVHKHKKERKVRVANNGIDILVAPNEIVEAIASGEIKAIMELPGQNTSMIIDHGSFYSVYSNVHSVTAALGDKVKMGEPIAKVARDKTNASKLHFELWKGTKKVNPENYLRGSLR